MNTLLGSSYNVLAPHYAEYTFRNFQAVSALKNILEVGARL